MLIGNCSSTLQQDHAVSCKINHDKSEIMLLGNCSLRAWTNDICLPTKHHQTLFGDQTFYRLDTLFGTVWSCSYVFDRVWLCLIKFEGHQTFQQQLKTFLLFWCLMYGECLVRLDSRVSNMFEAGIRTTLAQRLVSIVWSVFDQICFNRLATHFKSGMFGHATMFDGVWSPNIYRLPRPLLHNKTTPFHAT